MRVGDEELATRARSLRPVRVAVRRADGSCVVEDRSGSVLAQEGRREVLIPAAPDALLCAVGTDGLLFVGSEDAANNVVGLESAGVGAILNVAFGNEAFPGRFRYMRAPLLDVPDTRLSEELADALRFVSECERDRVPLLVHCNAGVSRSISVVVAHLILTRGMSYDKALAFVASTRPAARPNVGFEKQLREMESIKDRW